MSRLTMNVHEIREGDVLSLGGLPCRVVRSEATYRDDLWVVGIVSEYDPSMPTALLLSGSDVVDVERPDPDAELVQALTPVIWGVRDAHDVAVDVVATLRKMGALA